MIVPPLQLDHLVIAARTLEEGAGFIAGKFGVETSGGGAHPLTRTHNRLLNLWGGAYLEVIAIDPAAVEAPDSCPRARLFAFDDPAFCQRLESGPQLVHWVARVARPRSLTRWQAQYPGRIAPVVAMSRGTNRWNLTVPDDGSFPAWQEAGDGLLPSLIQWDTLAHPSAALPETGIALRSLTGFHPRADCLLEHMAWLGASHLMNVEVTQGAPVLVAEFELPDGSIVTMGESFETVEATMQAAGQAESDAARPARRRAKAKKTEDVETSQSSDAMPGNPRQTSPETS